MAYERAVEEFRFTAENGGQECTVMREAIALGGLEMPDPAWRGIVILEARVCCNDNEGRVHMAYVKVGVCWRLDIHLEAV
jgi:hypothetical protein